MGRVIFVRGIDINYKLGYMIHNVNMKDEKWCSVTYLI